jgi:hypothetical protein
MELRKRTAAAGEQGGDEDDSKDFTPLLMGSRDKSAPPTAFDLLNQNPAKSGFALKKSNSCLTSICPCWFPEYKRRFFILIGNFLYRYGSESGERPKGVPIPLDAVTISTLDSTTFKLKMIRKDYIIRCDTPTECSEWVKAITSRKYLAIREELGHSPIDPAIKELNSNASKMFLDRLEREQEETKRNLKAFNGGPSSFGQMPNFSMGQNQE